MPRHDFWVRLWACIWKRLAFGSGDWVKGPSSAVWAGISQLGAWREENSGGRQILSSWAGRSSSSCPWMLELLVLRPPDSGTSLGLTPEVPVKPLHSDWITVRLSWFSGLCTADGETSQPPQPQKPVPVTNLFMCLFYWLCFSGELTTWGYLNPPCFSSKMPQALWYL